MKLGLRLLAGAPPVFTFRFDMIFSICFRVACGFCFARGSVVACPYKELVGRLCMQIQMYEKARSRISAQLRTLLRFKNTIPGFHESGGDLFLRWSFEVITS